ncbi:stimulated by retinoic acid gene 6 protein-like isoform X2 [Varanus komodoensis]|uniref:stimulated by retinoic acid gene 6 protein-like isoform X2 n=1 Tax=Varanus komodoensis TaxID=61221 RepID=UPI001CF7BAC1|nr:stimulated by retinoic acid gene 6 protein-like isoform X2 [Varanus komodoensis]
MGKNAQNNSCIEPIESSLFLHYSLIPSFIIIIVLAFLEKRARRCCFDENFSLLSRRFGVLIPFDFVDLNGSYSNRWSVGFAFGVTADKVMFLFLDMYIPVTIPGWAKVFWVLLIAIEVGISSYPFFVCLSTRHRLTGAIFGFLYTATWLAITLLDIFLCSEIDVLGEHSEMFFLWPSILSYLFLLGRFVFIFVKEIRIRRGLASENEEISFMEGYQAKYVHRLFRKRPLQPDQKSWIQRKLYHWDPHFKFPTRLISTIVLVIRCLYTFVILEFLIFKALNSKLRELADSLNILALSVNETENTFISAMEEFATITFDVWVVTTIISCITSLTYLFNILVCYRKHIKLLQSGKKHFLLPDPSTLTSSHSVVALGKYISWQVAYTIWGYLIMHLIQWVFVIILVYLFILPMKRGEWMNLLNNWGTTILSLVIITIIRQLQVVVAGRFFLQPKISPQDKQKPLALDNWRAFVNFNYFLFFHSVVVGLLSCLMRLFRSVILGAWLVGRLDRPLMPAGFESCDKGFCTWVEMLALDHYHTNPILGCFCYILHRANRERQEREAMAEVAIMDWDGSVFRVSSRARTRWLVLYTLMNNPSLLENRKLKLRFHLME